MNRVFLVWGLALAASAIGPKDRLTWFMEVAPVLLAAPVLWWTRHSFVLPNWILFWIGIHGLVLILGGHYTYAEVPFGFWLQDLFGFTRNPYDRIGHFFQGFVPALLANEILRRSVDIPSFKWRAFLSITIAMAISASYELLEWWAALALGQDAEAFLGTQGDPWDTQWDMFMATLGAIVAQLSLARNALPKPKIPPRTLRRP